MTNPSWTVNDQSKVEATVGGSYVDKLRQRVHCRFCGGKTCRHEDWKKAKDRKNTHIAIEGLHSNWVEDYAIASQRPSSVLIAKYKIVEQFHALGVKAVFNLQETGEHPFCGPQGSIHPESGFSYIPETELMPHGISHYNFPWPDMCTPNFDTVLRTVQVMCDHVSKGEKFLVHCHAGLGRTGLMIACWIMYNTGLSASETIQRVRNQRPGSIQTSRQLKFTNDFGAYLSDLRMNFGDKKESLNAFLARQATYLHGQEARALRYVPKVLHVVLTRLLDVVDTEFHEAGLTTRGSEFCNLFIQSMGRDNKRLKRTSAAKVASLKACVNRGSWKEVQSFDDAQVLIELLLDFLAQLDGPTLDLAEIEPHIDACIVAQNIGSIVMTKPLEVEVTAPDDTISIPHPPTRKKKVGDKTLPSPSPTNSVRSSRLPPLGQLLVPNASASNPVSPTASQASDASSTSKLQQVVSPKRRQEAILNRVAYKLNTSMQKSEQLASHVLKKQLALPNYHTAGVLLSSLRLMSWDLPCERQLAIMEAGVEILARRKPNEQTTIFFLAAAKEWGDTYFTRCSDEPPKEDIGSIYSQWLSELFTQRSCVGNNPYDLDGCGTPPEPSECGSPLLSPTSTSALGELLSPAFRLRKDRSRVNTEDPHVPTSEEQSPAAC